LIPETPPVLLPEAGHLVQEDGPKAIVAAVVKHYART
jgi:hypothetical protein